MTGPARTREKALNTNWSLVMSAPVAEQYGAAPMAANSTFTLPNPSQVGGFLCVASGTLSVGLNADGSGTKIVDALPVSAGIYYPLPMSTGQVMGVVLAGGAKGTIFGNW